MVLAGTALLVAGTASVASPAPGHDETTARVRYGDRSKPRHAMARTAGWIELASATPASHGREFIVVGADAGTFTQLRLSAASGRPAIRSVRVDFQDGSREIFPVGRALASQSSPAYVDLRGAHEIRQIVVVTDRTSRGSYVLEGNTSDTGVATR